MAPRNLRKKKPESDDDDEDPHTLQERIDDARVLIKNRAKAKGVGAETLALGDDKADEATAIETEKEEAPQVGLREMNAMAGAFAAGARGADPDAEDPHMLKYVEGEMARRRGTEGVSGSDVSVAERANAQNPHDALWQQTQSQKSKPRDDDESADRYLTGIVEVQLPVEFKFKNIEDTERAKAELLKKQSRRRDGGGQLNAPTHVPPSGGNFSSNFALHKKQFAANLNQNKKEAKGHGANSHGTNTAPITGGHDNKSKRDRAENVASDDYVFKRWMNNEKKKKH